MSKNEKELAEKQVIGEAKLGWRRKLYQEAYDRRKKEDDGSPDEEIDRRLFEAMTAAFEGSLGIKKNVLESDLATIRRKPGAEQELINTEEEEDETELYEE